MVHSLLLPKGTVDVKTSEDWTKTDACWNDPYHTMEKELGELKPTEKTMNKVL